MVPYRSLESNSFINNSARKTGSNAQPAGIDAAFQLSSPPLAEDREFSRGISSLFRFPITTYSIVMAR